MRILIVGGGIVGLAHAVAAVRRGWEVTLVERNPQPAGASVRNFGMVWIIGQPAGECRELALVSREHWLRLAGEAGFWCSPCGSLHVARHADELAVIEEFVAGEGEALGCEVLTPEATRGRCPAVREEGLMGALWSPHELAVDPREAIARITTWHACQPRVTLVFGHPIVAIDDQQARSASGRKYSASSIYLCTGADFGSFPIERRWQEEVTRCKLQMLRTAQQPAGWRLGPHVAGGLSLRHYDTFAACPSMAQLRKRFRGENPLYDRFGIHVMAAQNGSGEVLIGDSHEYGQHISPFSREEIDDLILAYAGHMLDVPESRPVSRWHGVYLKCTGGRPFLNMHPNPSMRVVNGLGGAGMTLSLELAVRNMALETDRRRNEMWSVE
ncbi:MAG: TIGR03364 family FAD-dependent oxidoreductase [Candidatus Hydrogenedentes bacterium]|nr:TIGR03364 family FAD-dependent oxidoreductase [Candidatus Hydrogenedentota bacterium]